MNKLMVIYGGYSSEHDISLKSYTSVIKVLKKYYDVYSVYISKDGKWLYEAKDQMTLCLDRDHHGIYLLSNHRFIAIDKALIIMHGKYGEDGRLQGLLEMANIDVLGCDMRSSMLAMDKDIASKLVSLNGIKVANSVYLNRNEKQDINLKYPLFVKPVKQGSSIGISLVNDQDELDKAIAYAFEYDDEIKIEEMIIGNEVGCSIIGNKELLVSEVDEIFSKNTFFNYEQKYHDSNIVTMVPSPLAKDLREKIQDTAIKIYKTLKCQGFARIDMFITNEHEIYFNEVNTIPGLTDYSRFPKMFEASGYSFEEMVKRMVEYA